MYWLPNFKICNVKLQTSRPWEVPECRAELHWGTVDGFPGPWEVLQYRVRTWLQFCTLILELGVLILEWVERCDKAERDGAECGLWQSKMWTQGGTRFYIKGGCSRIDRMQKWAEYNIRAKVLSQYSDWSLTTEWVSLIYGRKMGIYGVVNQDRSKCLLDK